MINFERVLNVLIQFFLSDQINMISHFIKSQARPEQVLHNCTINVHVCKFGKNIFQIFVKDSKLNDFDEEVVLIPTIVEISVYGINSMLEYLVYIRYFQYFMILS
jgi:hypothetical protein